MTSIRIVIAGVMLLILAGCHQTESIRFENRTDLVLEVYDDPSDKEPEFILESMESKSVGFLRKGYEGMIIAKDVEGNVVFQETLTWKQLTESPVLIE